MENKRTILYAEDDKYLRKISLCFFEKFLSEYSIEDYVNGTSLENRLKEDKKNIIAVVTDNQMPGIEGSEIIKRYANDPEFFNIPFLLVYGGDEEIGKQAIKDGAYSFIRKPILEWKDYCNKIKEAIDSKNNLSKIN